MVVVVEVWVVEVRLDETLLLLDPIVAMELACRNNGVRE